MTIRIEVNGASHLIESPGGTPLLYVLRNELGLKGTRFGCGEGTCGTCTVSIDGVARHSCDLPVEYVGEGKITTIEGLAAGTSLSPLQQAFVAEQAAQCGFCSSGILLRAQVLLDENPHPSETEIREALDENLCRCGSHARVIRAVARVAGGEDLDGLHRAGPGLVTSTGAMEGPGMGNDYVTVGPSGTILLTAGKVEIGQGISTALGQIAADELCVDIRRIRIVAPDTAMSPDEGYTSASVSIERGGANVRRAAGELRTQLLAMASLELGAEPPTLRIADGRIVAPDRRSVTYWELAGSVSPEPASIGSDPGGLVVGSSIPRSDLPGKFRGEASFVHDLELPGMLHGRIIRPPGKHARLKKLDGTRASAASGVVKVVQSGSFIGVIAQEEHQAVDAAELLERNAEWDIRPGAKDLADPRHLLTEEVQTETVFTTKEEVPAAVERSFSAMYTRPFLAHASVGPSCAVAVDDESTLTVWSHAQGVFPLRNEIARVLERPPESVRAIHMEGPGCYGHNGADDCALDAALLAGEVPGHPVRVMWSRSDEFLWEPYGSAMAIQLEGSLDDQGNIIAWDSDVWSYVHSARPAMGFGFFAEAHLEHASGPPRPDHLPAVSAVRNAVPIYTIPNVEVRGHIPLTEHVRTSALRSLGAHGNVFAVESLMDEMAHEIGESPVSFRLRHLTDPRAREVLQAVAELSGGPIGGTNAAGHGFGLGLARYKNEGGYAAVVAEIEAETEVRVVHVWAVVDAGLIVNPDGARNQIEGGIIQSASWALKERVDFLDGSPNTRGWEDYPILTFAQVPHITVELIDRPQEASTGIGEVVQGPTTAAIANGLRAVLGVPIRDLPFTADRVMKALLG